jgi:hypothetical protein
MENPKRATVYFDASGHRALRLKATATDRSISDLVNDAVKAALAEDAEDLAALERPKTERGVSLGSRVRDLRKRGRIQVADQAVDRKGDRGDPNQAGSSANRRACSVFGDGPATFRLRKTRPVGRSRPNPPGPVSRRLRSR